MSEEFARGDEIYRDVVGAAHTNRAGTGGRDMPSVIQATDR